MTDFVNLMVLPLGLGLLGLLLAGLGAWSIYVGLFVPPDVDVP